MKEFDLEIVTPDGIIYSDKAESLLVRTADGDVEILAGHVEYMASLGTGRARIKAGGKDRLAAVSGGFLTVSGGKVRLVAVTFEFGDMIDLERAKLARQRAEEAIKHAEDKRTLAAQKARLMRALARIGAHEG